MKNMKKVMCFGLVCLVMVSSFGFNKKGPNAGTVQPYDFVVNV